MSTASGTNDGPTSPPGTRPQGALASRRDATRWWAESVADVAAAFDVDPAVGLTGERAAELLAVNGPNALPEEKPKPGWRRFLDQYRSYMQIILVVAAVVSLVIKEWSTAVLLVVLTVVNAVVGPAPGGQGRERDERAASR